MSALETLREAVAALEQPAHGPVASPEERQLAGKACVALCNGDADRGRTLWRLIVDQLGGYMPRAAAVTLIRVSDTTNIVPDVTAPEVT